MSVPNQKNITVNKKEICDKEHLYTVNNLNALDFAAGNLISTVGFKLYMYIAKNQDNYNFDLSNVLFQNWANCGRTAYSSAVAELIDKGYLVQREGNNYDFYELPRIKEEVINISFPARRNYTMTV